MHVISLIKLNHSLFILCKILSLQRFVFQCNWGQWDTTHTSSLYQCKYCSSPKCRKSFSREFSVTSLHLNLKGLGKCFCLYSELSSLRILPRTQKDVLQCLKLYVCLLWNEEKTEYKTQKEQGNENKLEISSVFTIVCERGMKCSNKSYIQ